MRYLAVICGSIAIGVITSLTGYGWIEKETGAFNPVGVLVSTCCVLAWVAIVNLIANKK